MPSVIQIIDSRRMLTHDGNRAMASWPNGTELVDILRISVLVTRALRTRKPENAHQTHASEAASRLASRYLIVQHTTSPHGGYPENRVRRLENDDGRNLSPWIPSEDLA